MNTESLLDSESVYPALSCTTRSTWLLLVTIL